MPSESELIEQMFGTGGGTEGSLIDEMFPTRVPTVTPPVVEQPRLGMYEQLRKTAEEKPSIFGFRPTDTLSMSIEEIDRLEMNPVLGEEFRQGFMDTMRTYGSLAGKPEEFVRGFSDLMITVPGFMLGVANAGRKILEASNVPGNDLLDYYEAASDGMGEVMEFWGPQVAGRITGKPTRESELAVGTMIAPIPFLHALGEKVAFGTKFPEVAASVADELSTWVPHLPIIGDVLNTFSDKRNVQGAVMFMSDLFGLAGMHKAWKGPDVDSTARLADITSKAVKVAQTEKLIEGIPDEAIRRAEVRQLEIQKLRLEKEAADLKAQIDADQATVENLRSKGRKVKKIKGFRTPEQRQAEIEKAFKAEEKAAKPKKAKKAKKAKPKTEAELVEEVVAEPTAEPVVEERTAPLVDRSSGLPTHPTDTEAIAAAQEHNLIYHGWADEAEYGKQHGYWYSDATTRSSFRVGTLEDLPRKVAEMRGEPEPISEVDTLTGTRQPEQLSTHDSPFRETPERTQQLKEQFATHRYQENVELMTQKLLNDVNRYLDGEDVDVGHTRELLSTLATRREELWREFGDPAAFTNWKDLIVDAAEWARRAERGAGAELRSKIEQRAPEEPRPVQEYDFDEPYHRGKVEAIKRKIEVGERPTVEVRAGDAGEPIVTDGIHTLQAYKELGIEPVYNRIGVEEDLALIKALEDQYKKPIEQITDEEVEKFFVEGEGAGKKVDWFGEGIQLNIGIPIDKFITAFRGVREKRKHGRYVKDESATEGVGIYVTKSRDLARQFGDVKKVVYKKPKNPLYVVDEELPLLSESDTLFEPVSESDSIWIKANKEAVKRSGVTEDHWKGTSDVARELTNVLREWGYDAVKIRYADENGRWIEGEGWDVILDKSLVDEARSEIKLYSGLPLDEAAKQIVAAAKKAGKYVDYARGYKRVKPKEAARALYRELKREWTDRKGNIRFDLLDLYGNDGYEVVQRMYLQKGAPALSANMLKQMMGELKGGLSRQEKMVFDSLALYERIIAISKTERGRKMKWPESPDGGVLNPDTCIADSELIFSRLGISPDRRAVIENRVKGFFEWMKRPLRDMYDSGLISEQEYNDLVVHNYRRLELADIFDRKTYLKSAKTSVYDSGIQALARGRETDIFEPSSDIMALETFSRAYGRILKNEANKELLSLYRKYPDNPFVRAKEKKGDRIPSGWQRIYVFEEGQRRALFLSPDFAKEWVTYSPEITYKMGQILRYGSLTFILRPMATGINWGFALANLPRDVMHAWYTSRVYEDGKWKMVYNPNLPVFLTQMGLDQLRVFNDALRRKGRYTDYINEGGGMEFLVHQGRLLSRGRKLGGPFNAIQDYLGYFGETTEIMTRLAIRERVIRRRAREQGITYEQAVKNPDITREATFAARDYMDFGQGGSVAKAMDNGLPYLNAAIQGTRGLFRAFKDNPVASGWKTAQLGAVVVGTYLAAKYNAPNAWRDLRGSVDMQNNLCIPLPESLSYEDENGQRRYPYLKIPLDPGQKFFKTFFEAATDKMIGEPVDVNTVTDSLKQMSPVGVTEMPPSLSAAVGYVTNKDFWLNEDIWRRTDKPFSWPRSREEYIPGKTPQAMIDIGQMTGLSPERMNYALEEIFTGGTMWSYILGKGYDELFSDLPDSKHEQTLVEVLSKVPVIKRFLGVTHPYSKHAEYIGEAQEKADLEYFIQNRGLDTLAEGYLFEKNASERDVYKYIRSFKDPNVIERLTDRYQFMKATKDLPERSFWLRLHGLKVPARAEAYLERMDRATVDERRQLRRELPTVAAAGGVLSESFWAEVNKLGKER